jgi:hypothetical protein
MVSVGGLIGAVTWQEKQMEALAGGELPVGAMTEGDGVATVGVDPT